ncbi:MULTISPECIES: DUF3052 domain-containing protein [Kribbella]|jgi:hypothetical protein|uniref:DUF3052 domain-containing protein n=1 Tax=Kribbella pratensis TaxID=2512112 RepID=A0ABY2F8R7_9ACTN|nr:MULTISPECIES: DUF3052 domain-containing protein [Kribbella]TDW86904.1 hypothetical protein EV137_4973 [Kribbella pratensis]TDW91773.1 hypothetical protein EV647_5355 [Kribbella sp. VKM Ac-2566]
MSTPGYSGKPLAAKLGIKADHLVLLDNAPAGFVVEGLPPGTSVARRAGRTPYDVVLMFCPDRARLTKRLPVLLARTTTAGMIWTAWPKRSSGVPTDLDENGIRELALPLGVVDVKVCAIDATWSGLKLVRRLSSR